MPDARRTYHGRLDAVLDHVRSHLTEPLTVERLADVACFSTSHFHRVFTAMMGETVGAYVRRARLERAAQLMRARPRRSIGSVAMESGFASFSDFSRAFRRYFGVAPSRWDRRTSLEVSNNCQDDNDPRGDILRTWIDTDAGSPPVAELIELPSLTLAYVRVQNPSADGALARGCDTLRTWLRARRLPAADAFDAASRIRDDWVLIGTSWDDDVLLYEHLRRRGMEEEALAEVERWLLTDPQSIPELHEIHLPLHLRWASRFTERMRQQRLRLAPAKRPAPSCGVRCSPRRVCWQPRSSSRS